MKYTIELTEKQARLLSYACDQFARLIQGQDNAYQELFESAWERRCKEATGHSMDDEFEGGWQKMREDAETFCKEIKKRFWNLGWCSQKGIHYDDTADIIFDLHCAIRHELWKNQPEPKSHITVDSDPPHQFGSEPIAKVTSKEEDGCK